jgi:hypothetical protein
MALTTVVGRDILIVLDEENIERIQQNDPFELDVRKMPSTVALPVPFRVVICYAKKSELQVIAELAKRGDQKALRDYLYRGFKVETGDSDDQYTKLKP